MNNTHYQTHNATIVSFPPFSGGKFLMNCLSLSMGACPQDHVAARYLMQFPDDYQYRLHAVMGTLPDRASMRNWREHEFGDSQLYGNAFHSWTDGQYHIGNEITQKLCESTMRFFITDNSMQPLNLVTRWPNSLIIKLTDSRRFQSICVDRKTGDALDYQAINGNYCEEKYNYLRGEDWPTWKEFERRGYDVRQFGNLDAAVIEEISKFYCLHLIDNQVLLFDVDQCYFDQSQFLKSMRDLYFCLGFTDFQPSLLEIFYKKYIELHI